MTGKRLPFDPIEEAHRNWTARGWSQAADGMAAVTSIMRAEQIFLARVHDVLRPFDLTFARYEALALISFARRGALPLSTIGERLQVHPASVTNTIDRLEGKGLVVRRPHPTDRRTTLAEITEEGRAVVDEATGALNATTFVDTGLDDDELRALFGLLRRLRQSAGDFDA